MSEEAIWARMLGHRRAVLLQSIDETHVEVRVGDEAEGRTITRSEWDALEPWSSVADVARWLKQASTPRNRT